MNKEYKVIDTPFGGKIIQCEQNGILLSIPFDEANPDYQAYLRWLNGEPELEPIVRDPAPAEEVLIQEVTVNE
jgi:hypothetical protein